MVDTQGPACRNCGSTTVEIFCAQCGQAQSEVRVPLRLWLGELLNDFSLNARLPRTLWLLFAKPGFLSEEWRNGRRARYVSPLRLYILASVVFFSIIFFVGLPIIRALDLDVSQFGTELASSAQELRNEAVARRMQGFFTLGAALSVPLLALWMRILSRRSGLLYVDHLVGSLHIHSALLVLLTPAYVLLFFGVPGYVGAATLTLYGLIYWVTTWWRTYRPEKGLVRSVWSLGVASAGWGILGLAILIGEMFLFSQMFDVNVRAAEFARRSYGVARTAFHAGDVQRARYIADEGLRAFSFVDTTALVDHEPFHVAELHLWAGEPDSAHARSLALLEEDPEDLLALGLAGASAEEMGDSAAAREFFGRLMDLVDTGAMNDKGHEAYFQRYLHSARTYLERATKEDMRLTAFLVYQSAYIAFEDGLSSKSQTLAREALDAFERVDSAALGEHDRFHIGELLYLDHRWDGAWAEAEALLAQDSTDLLALGLAGTSAHAIGDTASARSRAERLLELTDAGEEPLAGHAAAWRRYLDFARARVPD